MQLSLISEVYKIESLKANPRFWSDPLYRGNVIEFIRIERSKEIIERVLTLQEGQEALSAEFLLLNKGGQ